MSDSMGDHTAFDAHIESEGLFDYDVDEVDWSDGEDNISPRSHAPKDKTRIDEEFLRHMPNLDTSMNGLDTKDSRNSSPDKKLSHALPNGTLGLSDVQSLLTYAAEKITTSTTPLAATVSSLYAASSISSALAVALMSDSSLTSLPPVMEDASLDTDANLDWSGQAKYHSVEVDIQRTRLVVQECVAFVSRLTTLSSINCTSNLPSLPTGPLAELKQAMLDLQYTINIEEKSATITTSTEDRHEHETETNTDIILPMPIEATPITLRTEKEPISTESKTRTNNPISSLTANQLNDEPHSLSARTGRSRHQHPHQQGHGHNHRNRRPRGGQHQHYPRDNHQTSSPILDYGSGSSLHPRITKPKPLHSNSNSNSKPKPRPIPRSHYSRT